MRLLRLQLADYRNFHRLDLSLGPGASVFIGANAQGKTNLLEAVSLLATMKELRAESEAQVIRREAAADPIPAARVVGEGETAAGPLKVEVVVIGLPKRLSDAVGRLTAVLFTAADIDLISGAPSARRRYIDITLSQVDSRYVVARSRLERVIAQRNHLLKRMREGLAQAEELSFWDAELARDGGYVFAVRGAALSGLAALAGGGAAGPPAPGLGLFPDGCREQAAVFQVTAGAVSVAASQPVASRGTAESCPPSAR